MSASISFCCSSVILLHFTVLFPISSLLILFYSYYYYYLHNIIGYFSHTIYPIAKSQYVLFLQIKCVCDARNRDPHPMQVQMMNAGKKINKIVTHRWYVIQSICRTLQLMISIWSILHMHRSVSSIDDVLCCIFTWFWINVNNKKQTNKQKERYKKR